MSKPFRDRFVPILISVSIAITIAYVAMAWASPTVGNSAASEGNTTILLALGGLQTISLLLLGWIKMDVSELWKRADKHGHQIECDGENCKPKTIAVIIHE